MNGKKAVITGASSGLGEILALELAQRGWSLVLINRSRQKTLPLLERIEAEHPGTAVEVVEADLSDQDALRSAADAVAVRHPRIDALFNNAALLLGELALSRHGNEMQFQVNTLAPYMLMRLLRTPLAAARPSVIVNVSSGAALMAGPLKVGELRRPPQFRKLFGAYGQSKLALSALTQALAADFQRDGVAIRSVDPGGNRTPMTAGAGMPAVLKLVRPLFFRAPEVGARRIYDAAFDPKYDTAVGSFLTSGKVVPLPASATDPQAQSELLGLCRELTGL
jgi:NAD(P)-dependent dehydrogenase (short-subunit alcohol dehydrogenase family)